jgi:hypothetical protein
VNRQVRRSFAILCAVLLAFTFALPRSTFAFVCVAAMPGANVERITTLSEFNDASPKWLILSKDRLLLFDVTSLNVRPVNVIGTTHVSGLTRLDSRTALIETREGFLYFLPSDESVRRLKGPAVSEIKQIRKTTNGDLLAATSKGLFRITSTDVMPVKEIKASYVRQIYDLSNFGWLIEADDGIFVSDASASKFKKLDVTVQGPFQDVVPIESGGWLLNNFAYSPEFFYLDPAGNKAIKLSWNDINKLYLIKNGRLLASKDDGLYEVASSGRQISERPLLKLNEAATGIVSFLNGDMLISSKAGIYFFSSPTSAIETISSQMGAVYDVRGGPEVFVVASDAGSFRLDRQAGSWHVHLLKSGEVYKIYDLGETGWLVDAEDGIFRINRSADETTYFVGPSAIIELKSLGGSGWIVRTETGTYHLAPDGKTFSLIPGRFLSQILSVAAVGDGGLIFAAQNGLFRAYSDFSDAKVELKNKDGVAHSRPDARPSQTDWLFSHPCAVDAAKLNLSIVAGLLVGEGKQESAKTSAFDISAEREAAKFISNIAFSKKGIWRLQAVSTQSKIDFLVGKPIDIMIEESFLEVLQSKWHILVAIVSALYVLIFGALIFISHWGSWAFRIASDPIWSKIGIWPFFALRYIIGVQLWVLEPWFREYKSRLTPAPYLELPAIQAKKVVAEAGSLLVRLRSNARIWLQGGAGMGKSSVFGMWERTYFLDSKSTSLARARRRYGFILVTIPVRQFAELPADANNLEAWVIEASRKRFEQFGLDIADASLIKAMFKRGAFALALDGMNEANRDAALAAFARTFPQVRLLVTSQGDPLSDFEKWNLPDQVADYAPGLLQLWLGEAEGNKLADTLKKQGLLPHLLSGYDIRLIADIAGGNVNSAPLPDGRIALYRTVLSKALSGPDAAVHAEALKRIAWKLLVEGRRDLREPDIAIIGEHIAKRLQEGTTRILRKVSSYSEFRHDQMRAFLAAGYLVDESPNVESIVERLADSEIWNRGRRDQEELWSFLCQLLAPNDLTPLWKSTLGRPKMSFMQAAIYKQSLAAGFNVAA